MYQNYIETMKQALEALEDPIAFAKGHAAKAALRLTIEQAEKQEPVGFVAEDISKPHLFYGAQYLGQMPNSKTVLLVKDLPLGTPVYTAPSQRQPLTEKEIERKHGIGVDQ
jgi:hypothetical protein